jgi:capsular exopolysaccharide synthesis family protein
MLAEPGPITALQQDALLGTQTLLNELRATYASLAASMQRPVEGLTVVAEADPAEARQLSPRTMYYTLLALVAGLLLAAGLAFILEYFDDHIRDSRAVTEATGLRTLSAIGKRRRWSRSREKTRLPTLLDPRSPVADAFRGLRANIDLIPTDAPIRTVAVVSARASEGKSITAANLAVAYAQTGRRVILVDADLRRPALHTLFHLDNGQGLTSVLRDPDVPIANVIHAVTQQDNLLVLTSGPLPLDPAAMLSSEPMRGLTKHLLEQADVLIFDTPPLQVAVDAAVVGAHADGSLLVIDASHSRRGPVLNAMAEMAEAQASMIGAVLYRARRSSYPDRHGYAKATPTAHAVKHPDSA